MDDYDIDERIAICMVDGEMTLDEARDIAFEQMMKPPDDVFENNL